MERISRQTMFMQMAEAASRRSTCFRRNVGAIIVVNNNVVSIGYNGPPSGEDHCRGNDCVPAGFVGCQRSIHAERNALQRWKNPGAHVSAQMYVTESPCADCCTLIRAFDVFSAVYYLNEYRITDGLDHLVKAGIAVIRMTPSGYMIDRKTRKLL